MDILVKKYNIVFVMVAFIFILTGCSDIKGPSLILNSDVNLRQSSRITENKLIELLVDTVSDDRSEFEEIKLSIENFDDNLTSTLGETEVVIKATDQSGNETSLATSVNVVERKEQVLIDAKERYRKQLVAMSSTGLFSDEIINQYQMLNERLTTENYLEFQDVLDQYQAMKFNELSYGNELKEAEINDYLREIEDSGFYIEQFIEPLRQLQIEANDMYSAVDIRTSFNEILLKLNSILE